MMNFINVGLILILIRGARIDGHTANLAANPVVSGQTVTTFCHNECLCVHIEGQLKEATCRNITFNLRPEEKSATVRDCTENYSDIEEILSNRLIFFGNDTPLEQLIFQGCERVFQPHERRYEMMNSLPATLKSLVLSFNHIQEFLKDDFDSLDHLIHLDISFNELSNIGEYDLEHLGELETLNLSGNKLKVFDASFLISSVPNLKSLHLSHSEDLVEIQFSKAGFFPNLESVEFHDNRKLSKICPWLFRSAPLLKSINVSHNSKQLLSFETLGQLKEVMFVDFSKVPLFCDCYISKLSERHFKIVKDLSCSVNGTVQPLSDTAQSQECWSEIKLLGSSPGSQTVDVATDVRLDCKFNDPAVSWVTPNNEIRVFRVGSERGRCESNYHLYDECAEDPKNIFITEEGHLSVLNNGSLLIRDFGWRDRGQYSCFGGSGGNGSRTAKATMNIWVKPVFRNDVYAFSLIYGFSTAAGFLLLTLIAKLAFYLLNNYGCCLFCCCCKDQLPPKARRLKNAIDSIEAYRTQQLEKLRENYNLQSASIRQNCALQMEKVRDNYNGQVQNLRDIRQYGSTQLTAVRDQYYEQMSRIRDYSTCQLDRVHENYIFQRTRLRKFSAQNYLKIRETRKYTQRTLNKVLESLPGLYLDLSTCKQGLGDRQISVQWDPAELTADMEILACQQSSHHLYFSPDGRRYLYRESESDSLYFTPNGTPMREMSQKPSTPSREIERESTKPHRKHRKARSFSNFLPLWLAGTGPEIDQEPAASLTRVNVVIEHETSSGDYLDIGTPYKDVQPDESSGSSRSPVNTASTSVDSSNVDRQARVAGVGEDEEDQLLKVEQDADGGNVTVTTTPVSGEAPLATPEEDE